MNSFFKIFFSSALGVIVGLIFMVIAALVVIPAVIAISLGSGHRGKSDVIKKNSILHLDIHGILTERHLPMGFELFGERSIFNDDRTIGLFELNRAIDRAKTDKRISGIYLDIHDFQAGWASVTSLRRHVDEFAKSGKWVYAYADHLDEIGYYLASAAKQIYMEPYGDLEFNGLTVQEMFYKGLLDKLGVQPLVFRVGRFKAAIEPLIRDKMSNENREQTQAMIDDIWSVVRDAAATTAKVDPKQIDQLANNLVVTSTESAKNAGLIHDTLFADAVEDKLREATVGKDAELELVSPIQYLHSLSEKKSATKKIAVIFAEGEIHSGEGERDSIGSDDLRQDIMDANEDDDVAAIVLRVNSPGGDALASDVIWRALRTADDEKPVVVSMGDVAASGGYYISSASRYIFAEPTTITGSIGVFGLMFNGEKALKDKAGISFDRVVTHAHADIGSYSRPMTAFESQTIQSDVERVYKRFLDVVQDGRGYEKRADLESIAEGRVWSGTRAKELGLVDELGGLDQAIVKAADFAKATDYKIEVFPADTDPLRHLLERFSGEAMSRISLTKALGPLGAGVRELSATLRPVKSGIYARLPYDLKIH
jgi:protease-4